MHELFPFAVLTAIIAGLVDLDSTAAWQVMISQPVVAAPLTGLFLGNFADEASAGLKLGLVVGTILQLVWIEQLPLGMNVPPDAALASVISVGLGFLAGRPYETYVEREVCNTVALLVAVALGLVGRSMDIWIRRLNNAIDTWVCGRIAEGDLRSVEVGHTLGGLLTFTKAFLFCFFVIMGGVEPLRYFTQSLNFNQNTGFIVIQGLLPAVGFAVLASRVIENRRERLAAIGGVFAFTFLPAWWVIPIGAAAFIAWRMTATTAHSA
ncbi:MAG: PTS sugar transporter subunit IIC [Candidatus Ozemobacteraceae bacterium]